MKLPTYIKDRIIEDILKTMDSLEMTDFELYTGIRQQYEDRLNLYSAIVLHLQKEMEELRRKNETLVQILLNNNILPSYNDTEDGE